MPSYLDVLELEDNETGSQVRTGRHIKMDLFLQTCDVRFQEDKQIQDKYWETGTVPIQEQ